ncbi:fatty acid desaturase family protein [Paracnuella aquatica]|uniref:fatty acid desaturase family protein n=1 Tax=Paracnuella aquatica TaxID=2268757 RepID=UPI0019D41A9D|nr:fatty acid desaturase [Paracnuella aquatica]
MHLQATTALPRFMGSPTDAKLFAELRKKVQQVLSAAPPHRQRWARAKAFVLPLLYLGFYALGLVAETYTVFLTAYTCLGLLLVIIFVNLIHEACHENLFRSKRLNRRYLLVFDLIGANSYMWKRRHVRLHHNYTNVQGWDSDIEKCRFLKVHPGDHKKWGIRYQHLLIFLYPLFITNWFLIRDFKDFYNAGTIVRKLGAPPLVEHFKLFFFKLFFVFYLFVVPLWLTPFNWQQIAAAFLLMLFVAGLFALLVLIPPHVNTSNLFPETDSNLELQQSWFMHQMLTTNDVVGDNWFSRHVLGNYNYHIAHHLFPNISYVYAKEVTAEIQSFCAAKGIPYRSYPLMYTFVQHYRLIRRNGKALELLEDDL